jgi:phosphomethylpyrimidine synthase
MEITQQVRDYAARLNEAGVELAEATTQVDPNTDAGEIAARQAGMDEMSQKFRDLGGQVYVTQDTTTNRRS